MAKFFSVPFAATGDKVSPPDAVQPDGSVSYGQGFGFDYQRKTDGSDPLGKNVPREQTNGIYYDITDAIAEIQRNGYPLWQEAGQPYPVNATVRHSGKIWLSLIANNNATPAEGASWTDASITLAQIQALLTGKASSGANSDITSLSGLTTPLSVAQGGTGGSTQGSARISLGLGSAATATVTTSAVDSTAGRLTKVGDFGIGSSLTAPTIADFKSLAAGGIYKGVFNTTLNSPPAVASAAEGFTALATNYTSLVVQWLVISSSRTFIGYYNSGASSITWAEQYGTGNLSAFTQSLLAATSQSAAQSVLGVPTPMFTKEFTSANLTLSGGGLISAAHNFGVRPKLVQGFIVFLRAVQGWSIGDETLAMLGPDRDDSLTIGNAVYWDTTTVYVRLGSSANGAQVYNKNTGAQSGTLAVGDIALKLRVWA